MFLLGRHISHSTQAVVSSRLVLDLRRKLGHSRLVSAEFAFVTGVVWKHELVGCILRYRWCLFIFLSEATLIRNDFSFSSKLVLTLTLRSRWLNRNNWHIESLPAAFSTVTVIINVVRLEHLDATWYFGRDCAIWSESMCCVILNLRKVITMIAIMHCLID